MEINSGFKGLMSGLWGLVGSDNSVGISTRYELDGPGIESRWGRDFPHLSRTALAPAQPPVLWVPGSFPGVKIGRGVMLTPQPRLVPWSWKSRAMPLLPLWAVRPVQSLSACTRVHITFTFTFFYEGQITEIRTVLTKGIIVLLNIIYITLRG